MKIPVFGEIASITCRSDKLGKYSVNITGITEEQELALDNGKHIELRRDGLVYNVNPKKVFCYGNIDFHTNSEDFETLNTFDWLDDSKDPCYLPTMYNYDKHCGYAKDKIHGWLWTETYDNARVAQWKHACIGKPERSIIFLDKHGKHEKY